MDVKQLVDASISLFERVSNIEGNHDELVAILLISKRPSIFPRHDVIETKASGRKGCFYIIPNAVLG